MLRKLRTSKAFTLAEIMIVVAIVAIISAIGIGGILSQIKSIRQMKLDTTARTIYVAAQNRLTELYSSGNTEWSAAFLASNGDASGTVTAAGNIEKNQVKNKPSDWGDSEFNNTEEPYSLYYVSSDSNDYTKRVLFPDGTINEELFGNNWVVEFNPESGYVYAVFYSEKMTNDQYYSDEMSPNFSDQGVSVKDIARANKESRISNFYSLGGVGYYGGAISINEKYDVQDLTNNINVKDEAELSLELITLIPSTYQQKYIDLELVFTGLVSGSTQTYTFTGTTFGSRKTASIVVDSLNTKKYGSFYENFCNPSRAATSLLNPRSSDGFTVACKGWTGNFIPGENVRATLVSKVRDDTAAKSVTSEVIINSLFSNDKTNSMGAGPISGGTGNSSAVAYIKNGRHLQNLNTETSHVNDTNVNSEAAAKPLIFTSAIQTNDINFSSTGTGSWITAYGKRPFTPITNAALNSYDGDSKSINALTAGTTADADIDADGRVKDKAEVVKSENAGLFADFAGSSLKNIKLTGTTAKGTVNAGALAAKASGAALTVENCSVYLLGDDYKSAVNKIALTKEEADEAEKSGTADTRTVQSEARISSETGNAGGLIGSTANGCTLNVSKSFASTIINGAGGSSIVSTAAAGQNNAGGLIGYSSGSVNISSSYADCYITGSYIGGLAGYSAGAANTVTGSYSAGFAAFDESIDVSEVSAGFMSAASGAADTVVIKGSYTLFDTGTKTTAVRWHMTNTETEGSSGGTKATRAESSYYANTATSADSIDGAEFVNASKLKESAASGTGADTGDSPITVMNKANGGAFIMKSADTTAYNLRIGIALTSYDYPHVSGLRHYGDWSENDIEPGTLVYYEKYKNGKYGFVGGGKNTLLAGTDDSTAVVDDGYALIYSADDAATAKYSTSIYFNTTTDAGKATEELQALTADPAPVDIANPGTTGWDKAIFRHIDKSLVDNAGLKVNEDGSTSTEAVNGLSDFYLPIIVKSQTGTNRYYYFNPYFARTAVEVKEFGDTTKPGFSDDAADKSKITIRSPRQLYLMSCFYETYADKTKLCIFNQELKLDYAVYDWESQGSYFKTAFKSDQQTIELSSTKTVYLDISRNQAPIGSEAKPFSAEYNGNSYAVTGMSVKNTDTGSTVSAGLFGTVSGALKNIVFTADYSAKATSNYAVSNGYSISGNGSKYYVGAIAGHLTSEGSIENTAAAGLVINSYAYDNAELNAGGLVGLNEGSISNSEADLPIIRIRTNGGAGAAAAGFAGYNRGSIENSYSLSYINISRAASDSIGQVYLGGFAARNEGNARISDSYCASATVSENIDDDKKSGFTLAGGGSTDHVLYLDGGNYYYVDSIYAYNIGDASATAGAAVSGSDLTSIKSSTVPSTVEGFDSSGAFAQAEGSYNCVNTRNKVGDGEVYPYPAVIKDTEGSLVHYGEWTFDTGYSDSGFIYWENEEGGSNRGYHFYIIDGEGNEHSTLCTAHDDGGAITDYGYGYYYSKASTSDETGTVNTTAEASWENVNLGSKSGFANAEEYAAAENALSKQFGGGYNFVLYKTTREADKTGTTTHEKNDKGMFLINQTYSGEGTDGTDITAGGAYAVCRLTVSKGSTSKELLYVFTPFFAKSMKLYSYRTDSGSWTTTDMGTPGSNNGESYDAKKKEYENGQLQQTADTGDSSDTSSALAVEDYMKEDVPFEIRSVYQLQNINWRTDKFDAVTEIGNDDAREIDTNGKPAYLYLAWYGDGDSIYGKGGSLYPNGVPDDDVYNYYWKQTHDVNGKSREFTPIGGLYDTKPWVVSGWSTAAGTKTQPFVAFFNGDYNGDSYVIRNISISSTSQTVGLFGTEVAAKLRNIILYSDSDNVIAASGSEARWYMLGSLVGLAGKGTIENCVVSGYTVEDGRTGCSDGDATIGAFIGFCATSINRCSSNNNLILKSTHNKNHRVGGMVGAITGKISNSYCGGSITNNSSGGDVYIAGMIGGEWFRGSGLEALTGAGNFEEGAPGMKPEIENCYSFIRLPNKSGNIQNVKVFATTADLDETIRGTGAFGATPSTITVKNCYYYGIFAGNALVDPVKAKGTIMDLKYLDADGNNISDPKAVMSLDYAAMSSTDTSGLLSKLNAGGGSFGMVTVTENGGQAINGKYSFPGSDKELIGQNYPFPTVITQEDPFDSTKTVNVHYGQWPKGTDIYSDASSMTLDLVSNSAGTHDCTANVAVKFYTESSAAAMTAEPVIGFKSTNDGTNDGISSDIVKCSLTASTTENGTTVPQYYILTIDGWKEGYETVSISYTLNGKTYKTYINLAVTAELNIKTWSADSTSSQPKVGTIVSYKANVYDRNFDNTKTDNKAVSGLTAHNWTAVTADTNIAEVKSSDLALDADGNIVIPVIGNKAGRTTLTITVNGIRPANYGTISGVTDTRSLTQTYSMDINVTEADALPASILIYADGKRIDTADKAVSVASGKTIADDSTSLANFNYWTEQVAAADSGYSLGRTFAGWITEDGKSVDQSTSFKTTTSIYASWKCTKLTFTDGGTECGSLYYYGGSFYKSSTLTDKADTAPQPSVHGGDETFAGYQFAADTETGSSMVKLTDSDCKLIDGALSGLTVGGATIDENMAELKVQAVFTDDTAVQP